MSDGPMIRCRPVWGSCNLPSGHAGQHNAYAASPQDGWCRFCSHVVADRYRYGGYCSQSCLENGRPGLFGPAGGSE